MDNSEIIKSVKLNEVERKFTVNDLTKKEQWEREFIIFQWYTEGSENRETKLKIIIDLHSFEQKFVRVSKHRVSNKEANKTVDYLNKNAIEFEKLIGIPFVCKRRSIKNDIHLDQFINSNGICGILLEDEGNQDGLENFCNENTISLLKDVTEDLSYRNINMTVDFNGKHLSNLNFILSIYNSSISKT